jgi:hypothetical protein
MKQKNNTETDTLIDSSRNRFDLEEDIYNCWNVVSDIRELHRSMLDRREMSEDEISNYLLGLETIYKVKFERLQETFEELVRSGAFKNVYDSNEN